MDKVIYLIPKANADTPTDSKVVRIRTKVIVKNITGTFNVTDIMLQTGDKSAIWNGHPSEMRWTFNE